MEGMNSMNTEELNEVSKTLFVPMGGRIYASEHFPDILHDTKALELKKHIPEEVLQDKRQSQYTFLASAVRCRNIDDRIREFLKKYPEGAVVELGCGLETTYFRTDNGKAIWYELDLPEVIAYRKQLIPLQDRMHFIEASAFDPAWMDELAPVIKDRPVLFLASGVFQYFEESTVIQLFNDLQRFHNAFIVFDAVSKLGMSGTRRYMKQLGKDSAAMYFYCDDANELARKAGNGISVSYAKDFYKSIDRHGMSFVTRVSMNISDAMHMVKLIELKLS